MHVKTVIADGYGPLLKGLRTLLEGEHDIEVLATASRASVVQVLRDQAPDVLVLDTGFGYGSAIQTIRTVVRRAPAVKVLALGMDSGQFLADRILEAGALGYLPKLCLAEELAAAVRTVAAGETYLSSAVK